MLCHFSLIALFATLITPVSESLIVEFTVFCRAFTFFTFYSFEKFMSRWFAVFCHITFFFTVLHI